jgi:hypothetical protein
MSEGAGPEPAGPAAFPAAGCARSVRLTEGFGPSPAQNLDRKDLPMASEKIRNPQTDQLLSPENSAFIIIDYQPIQVSSIRSMARDELVFNITSVAKAAVNYNLPIVHSTVNVATGRNKPPIQELQAVLGHLPTYDRTSINSWEDMEFKAAVKSIGRKKLIMTALWT